MALRHRWLAFVACLTLLITSAAAAQTVVTGVVIDSLTGKPLAGALVQMQRDSAHRLSSATTDSAGSYRMEGLEPGTYIVGFLHPRLDSLGIELSGRRVRLGPGAQRVDFAVPSAKTIIAAICPGTYNDSLGVLTGYVRDAETSFAIPGGVTVLWFELILGGGGIRKERQQIPVKTNDEGWFAICGLPSDVELLASATSGESESGAIDVRVPAGGILLRDFRLSRTDSSIAVFADSAASDSTRQRVATLRRGSARVSGTVHTPKGKPVANAEVGVPGSGLSIRTPESGVFSLGGLPAGTQSVEVRAIGFEPKRVAVDLTSDRLTTLDVVLDRPVRTLDVVKVFGKGPASSLLAFDRRRRAGWGRFLTPADIERRHAIRVTDLFSAMPGVRVVPSRFGQTVLVRGCPPTVYLNGMRLGEEAASDLDLLANPSEITAVEVYTAAGRPAEFWGSACGSIVIWAGMLPR
jgi:hypothetical protein